MLKILNAWLQKSMWGSHVCFNSNLIFVFTFELYVFYLQVTVQDFALNWLESFVHYLKQNLELFLNIPKYTDSRSHYRFKDYPEYEDGNHLGSDDNVFIYNQSQNPSSGSRGICCITMALINNNKNSSSTSVTFESIFEKKNFEATVSSEIIQPEGEAKLIYIYIMSTVEN